MEQPVEIISSSGLLCGAEKEKKSRMTDGPVTCCVTLLIAWWLGGS